MVAARSSTPAAHAAAPASPSEVKPLRRWDKLSTPGQFDAVFRVRCASHGEFARFLACPSAHPVPRLGITVGRKICKTAVGRNYMKRVSRALFQEQAGALQGLDVVVLVRKRFAAPDFGRFRTEFEQHVQRVQKCRDACRPSSAPISTPSARG